jgi:hypothetical protein
MLAPSAATSTTGAVPAPQDNAKKNDLADPYGILLDYSAEFKMLFRRYPGLETRLATIHDQTLPPEDHNTFPRIGGGVSWHPAHGGRQTQRFEPWTREVGLRKAAAALRQARTDPSELGDGVRDYCDLVLDILSKPEVKDLTALVRNEVVQGDAKTVEQLLHEDQL